MQFSVATPLRIGTRSSPLALAQANMVRAAFLADDSALTPDAVIIVPMLTAGDTNTVKDLAQWGYKGLFTKELEDALLAGNLHCAVHSMKDVPSRLPDGLIIAGMLTRDDARDGFISTQFPSFDAMPHGAIIGTSSVRRGAQIKHLRPDITLVPFRGNVGTRLKKLEDGTAHATFLACAGLNRLGLSHHIMQAVDITRMLPAIAQGAIGIECLQTSDDMCARIARISDANTLLTVSSERELLKAVDGTCRTPIAGYCVIDGSYIHLRGMVIAPDGSGVVAHDIRGPSQDAVYLGTQLGAYLKERGSDYLASNSS